MRRFFLAALLAAAAAAVGAQVPAKAVFAGGCFWCVEEAFEKVYGVLSAVSGYAGGTVDNPTYQQVSSGITGHTEVVEVTFDPSRVSYERLLYVFWRNIDPLDGRGQFCDSGSQYRTAIFTRDAEQKRLAEASRKELESSGRFDRTIHTEITPLVAFYPAEDYHQDYYKRSAARYKFYVTACGRYQRLDQVWGKESRPH